LGNRGKEEGRGRERKKKKKKKGQLRDLFSAVAQHFCMGWKAEPSGE